MDLSVVPSPCYVIDMDKLRANLEVLTAIQKESGCKIILALKGYATFSTFPLIRQYLSGTTASSVNEALLGYHEFGKEVHVYAPAYSQADMDALIPLANHISFNSLNQFYRFRDQIKEADPTIEMGLRINPEYSEIEVPIYDPSARYSRLGITATELGSAKHEGVTGLHFHTLCQQNADTLVRTLTVVESKFGDWFDQISWINLGGGHHITRPDYDRELLIKTIQSLKNRYGFEVYLEPGEAVVLNTGILVTEVLDIIRNEKQIAILDTSATAHMPDILEMPYRPDITGAGLPDEKPYTYQLGGLTCLAGDIIGEYSFDEPLKVGDRLQFEDMAHYTVVKNNCFNGVALPAIALWHEGTRKLELIRKFHYKDYRNRLS